MSLPLPLLTFLTSSLRCTDDRRFTAYYCDVECNLDEGKYNSGPRTCSGLIQASVRIHVCLCVRVRVCACVLVRVRVRESLSSLSLTFSRPFFLPPPQLGSLGWLAACLPAPSPALSDQTPDGSYLADFQESFSGTCPEGQGISSITSYHDSGQGGAGNDPKSTHSLFLSTRQSKQTNIKHSHSPTHSLHSYPSRSTHTPCSPRTHTHTRRPALGRVVRVKGRGCGGFCQCLGRSDLWAAGKRIHLLLSFKPM